MGLCPKPCKGFHPLTLVFFLFRAGKEKIMIRGCILSRWWQNPSNSKQSNPKTGPWFRFFLFIEDFGPITTPPHAGMYIPANRGAGTGPCRGVGQSPALLTKSFSVLSYRASRQKNSFSLEFVQKLRYNTKYKNARNALGALGRKMAKADSFFHRALR